MLKLHPKSVVMLTRCSWRVLPQRALAKSAGRGRLGVIFCVLASLLATTASWAVAPTNDLCSRAIVIPAGPFPFIAPTVDITDASTSGDPVQPPSCQELVTRSIWYIFTPTNTEYYRISSCSDATTVSDTVMAIYTTPGGCSDPSLFTLLACADDTPDTCFRKASLTLPLTEATKYYVVVWQYSLGSITPGNAKVQLHVSKAPPPPNDQCGNAEPLEVDTPAFGTTFAANNDYELDGLACPTGTGSRYSLAGGRDVVYTFTAPADGAYSIKVGSYTSYPNELVLYVASDCPAGPYPAVVSSCLASANRVLGGTAEEIWCLDLAAGQLIYIFVDEDAVTEGSNFIIEVNHCIQETEPNNSPETASPLVCGTEGALSTRSDEDYYALGTFPSGSRAFVLVDGSAALTTSFYVDLRTETNLVEVDTGDNAFSFGDQSGNIAGAIVPAQPTYVRVHNYPLRSINEPYRLYAVIQPPMQAATLETEPNSDYWTANSAPNNYFRGVLTNRNDVDLFSFNANANDLIFVSLDCDPLRNMTPFNGKLELMDADGKLLVSVDDESSISYTNASSPSSPGEGLTYQVAEEGTYLVRVSVSPDATGSAAAGDYLLSISKNGYAGELGVDTAPVVTNLTVTSGGNEGDAAVLSGRIVDPDAGEAFTLRVDWGDGTSVLVTNLPAGKYAFEVAHNYVNEFRPSGTIAAYPVSLVVSDNARATGATNTTVMVNNVPPSTPVLQLNGDRINEADSVALSGSFSDPGVMDTHAIVVEWGDGSPNTMVNLAAGENTFSANHRYVDDTPSSTSWDTYLIRVTVSDDGGASASATIPVIVSNVPPVLGAVTLSSPILANQTATLTGQFSDIGLGDTFTLEVNWADGSAVQTTEMQAPGSFSLQHPYALAGTNLSVQVTLRDDDGGIASTNLALSIVAPVAARLSTRWDNSWLHLGLEGTPGVTYRLQSTTNLVNWEWVGSCTLNNSGVAETNINSAPLSGSRLYRAVFP